MLNISKICFWGCFSFTLIEFTIKNKLREVSVNLSKNPQNESCACDCSYLVLTSLVILTLFSFFFFFGRIDILMVTQFQRWISNRIIHWFHLKRETEKLLWVSKECLTLVIHRTTRLRFAVYNIRIISFLLIYLFIGYFFLVINVMKGEIFWKKKELHMDWAFAYQFHDQWPTLLNAWSTISY